MEGAASHVVGSTARELDVVADDGDYVVACGFGYLRGYMFGNHGVALRYEAFEENESRRTKSLVRRLAL